MVPHPHPNSTLCFNLGNKKISWARHEHERQLMDPEEKPMAAPRL